MDTRATVAAIPGYSTPPNRVYYRIPASPLADDVARIQADVSGTFPTDAPFSPTVVAVFTWFAVGRYASRSDYLNTFQATIACDSASNRSYITFCYDNRASWGWGCVQFSTSPLAAAPPRDCSGVRLW